MPFKTKLDFSDNRQVKQRPETLQVLSGATSFGLPFSSLPTGPDLATSGVTQSYYFISSTFSGNSGTTIYSWSDSRMSLGESSLSALTSSNSATTQNTGLVFTGSSFTVIDGNTVTTAYSGVSFNITVSGMTDLGGGNYSGNVNTSIFNVLSANTLDFTGRTIWADVSGITRTERLIITNNPQVGYVWTCADTEGMGNWLPSSGVSADTNSFTTGATLVGTTAYFNRNDSLSAYTLNLSSLTSGTGVWSAGTGNSSAVLSGSSNIASGDFSVGEGQSTIASGFYSHAEGSGTTASGTTSHAEGSGTQANGVNSHAEGFVTFANGNKSHAEGEFTTASGTNSHSEGFNSQAIGYAAHAEGQSTIASGATSHAEGNDTSALGYASHAEGNSTTALGQQSHAEGRKTIASGFTSHAEGNETKASGDNSHAEGFFTTASSHYSHAEGRQTTASGSNGAHSEGYLTTASGVNGAHSEGFFTRATGTTSHAEGNLTIAGGSTSHAEGSSTTASGDFSHSEGLFTTASGDYSHSEGNLTKAQGDYSHAGGWNTIASGQTSFVHGSGSTAGGTNTIVLGANITGGTADTTYVDKLNIKTVGSGPGITDLGVDGNGFVVDQASDIKLKENINTIENALSKVLGLRGVTYNWKDREKGGNALKLGFIAQEVNEIIPELTYYNINGEYMGVHYKDVTALLVEAVKALASGTTTSGNVYLETQTILAEDNNIELNYSGNPETAIGGGIIVLHAKGNNISSVMITDSDGNWTTNNDFKAMALTIPTYTPTSSSDVFGSEGNVTRDDNYMYLKGISGWKRINLETF